MPREVSEISTGHQFSRTSESGRIADTHTRVFKVLLTHPGEVINIQQACGIYIGDPDTSNPGIFCTSFDSRFDGDSRLVIICTFTFTSTAGSDPSPERDPKSYSPEVRPANWSISSSLAEFPAALWKPESPAPTSGDGWQVPVNPAGDRYDGVVRMEPVISLTIEQFEPNDPTVHVLKAGVVNKEPFSVGSFSGEKRTLMFRGIQAQPTVESWGANVFRGWKCTYEFMYRKNYAGEDLGNIGWDVAIPQTGFNIINKEAALGGGVHEVGSLSLEHSSDGKIKNWPDDPSLTIGTSDKKCRAMVLVHAYAEGGASQVPCAQPIPLNDDGTPRSSTASPPVKVYRYQVQDEYDFAGFNLRLDGGKGGA